MVQKAMRFARKLKACTCGAQPLLVLVKGKNLYFAECPPCGVRTAKFVDQVDVERAWEAQQTERVPTLQAPAPLRRVA